MRRRTLAIPLTKPRDAASLALLCKGRTPGAAAVLSGRAGGIASAARSGRAAEKRAVLGELAALASEGLPPARG